MLAIKINNEFLELPAATGLEMTRNNPFLGDDVQGEYSMGLTVNYSDTNYRLLMFTGNFYRRNTKRAIDAEVWDNGMFKYAGKLIVQQHQSSMNDIEQMKWSCTFTIGAASFMQTIQDVLLQDVDLGGERSFNWAGYSTTAEGFWKHIHDARTPNAFPYTFYPIRNTGWTTAVELGGVTFMNKLTDDGSNRFEQNILNRTELGSGSPISLAPAIYLSFLLQQIFKYFGWTIDGDILNDTGFQKITVPSFRGIRWTDYQRGFTMKWEFSPFPTITFDLADHVPQDITIGSFLVSIKNRFGWYFDFDSNTKTAYLRSLKSVKEEGRVKDWTAYLSSNYVAEYQDNDKVYSLINNIDSNDFFPVTQAVDESKLARYKQLSNFPPPTSASMGSFAFAAKENSYYVCQSNTDGSYTWAFYAHNIGDYKPTGADSDFESDISTMPVALISHRAGQNILVPVCEEAGNFYKSPSDAQPWAIRFLFYHGMQPDSDGVDYPYASCHNINLSGTVLPGDWSLPYRFQYDAVNNGVYDFWWSGWLDVLSIQDFRTFNLQLPITELRKFSFRDIIVLNNVFFIVQTITERLPYTGMVEMKMKRIY